jgi:hypothetical protein
LRAHWLPVTLDLHKTGMHKTFTENSAADFTGTHWTCVTCGRKAAENFCANCGEKQHSDHDFSLGHVLAEAAEAFFHLDSKVFHTLRTLITKPGLLTADFFQGRRKPYMSPLQTFFVCNLIFFLLQPLTGLEILAPALRYFDNDGSMTNRLIEQRLEHKHVSRANAEQFEEFSDRFYHNSHLQAKSLILALAVMLAVVTAILNFRKHRYFSEHIIYCLHVYAWWLLWILSILIVMSVTFVLSKLSGHSVGIRLIDGVATPLEFGGLGVYLFFAGRRFYCDTLIAGIAKGVVLAICGYMLFDLYRYLLFFTVLYST